MKSHTLQLWFALLLPIVAFLGLVGRAELLRASGPVFHVAIAGYDPRDLLQGHYLRYRLQWPADGACDGATCCLCLQVSGVHTKVGYCWRTPALVLNSLKILRSSDHGEYFRRENEGEVCAFGIGLTRGFFSLFTTKTISVVKKTPRELPPPRSAPGVRVMA